MANPLLINGSASPQSIYVGDNTQWHPLGTKAILDDRVFYYSRQPAGTAGTAVFRGYLYSGAAQDANFLRKTTSGTVGQFTMNMSGAGGTSTLNQFAEGTIGVNTPVNPGSGAVPTGGSGYIYKVKSNDASATPTFTLYDPVVETLAAATATATANWYSATTISPGTAVAVNYAGVPQCNLAAHVAADAATYFWIQTSGPTFVAIEGTTVAGDTLTSAAGAGADAGCLSTLVTTTATKLPPLVGYCVSVATDEEFGLVWLTIRG